MRCFEIGPRYSLPADDFWPLNSPQLLRAPIGTSQTEANPIFVIYDAVRTASMRVTSSGAFLVSQ